ncbi:MAG: hypothetical protein IPO63_16860 [Bacteroidetes bacterium]|nr:hypothetical protein [Bacteroidota bacterium]
MTRKWDYPNAAYDNAFYLYFVDSTGIYPQPIQNVGTMRTSNGGDVLIQWDSAGLR